MKLKHLIKAKYHNKYNNKTSLKHNCRNCLYRHESCNNKIDLEEYDNCPDYIQGLCHTCQHYFDAKLSEVNYTLGLISEKQFNKIHEEWYMRGCEAWCLGGCKKYKCTHNIHKLIQQDNKLEQTNTPNY